MAARYFCFAILIAIHAARGLAAEPSPPKRELWYDQPAEQWTQALPVGNGHMGAMVFGGPTVSRWQFNDATLWTGKPHDYAHKGAAEYLPKIRDLLFADKQGEATDLAAKHFMSEPLGQENYQPCGDLRVEIDGEGEVSEYHRSLDLNTAIATTTYKLGDNRITQTTFASYPARAIVIRIESDSPVFLRIRLTSPHVDIAVCHPSDKWLKMNGDLALIEEESRDGMRFSASAIAAEHDGIAKAEKDALTFTDTRHLTLVLATSTNFAGYQKLNDWGETGDYQKRVHALGNSHFDDLLREHLADYQPLFKRVSLNLGGESADPKLPTDQRIVAAQSKPDAKLSALLFDYGRYLMIATSRPGSQPATLQGVWNDQMNPPWGSKYTCNINTEMNYWLTEPCNLPECAEPLYTALGELAESGKSTAREHYAAPGWVLHHNFDIWRGTAPINGADHGIWPTGGAWLCQHLWWRYEFSHDEKFLRDTAYPIMRSASEFFVHYLIQDPRTHDGTLISGPSNSPEQGGLVMGPTMDHQIIRDLLANTIAASEVLDTEAEFREQLKSIHARIAKNKIGQHGQLQEWLEDKDDPKNDHRHMSHMWGVHPGHEITPDTPELFAAARKSLEFRGDEGTGWSRAWKINLWARLRDGDHAAKVLGGLLTLTDSPRPKSPWDGDDTPQEIYRGGGVYPNLFDAHPPFQIDGNFGATAGICEMLLQSHRRTETGEVLIDLLPALPTTWPTGEIHGLRARDGFELDIKWRDGKLVRCKLVSHLGDPCTIAYGENRMQLKPEKESTTEFDANLAVELK